MEQFTTEVLPQARTLPAELPNGGLNGGPHLLGCGSTQHFNWHKHVAPSMWEFGTNYGVKHKYTAGGLDHQDIIFGKKLQGGEEGELKLYDVEGQRDSAEVWEATQAHVWGLRRDRHAPFAPTVARQVVGDETGIHEAGFEQLDRKEGRVSEFNSSQFAPDANTTPDGRVAGFNREHEDLDAGPSIQGGEMVLDLPQNERTAVRVV